jgi:hypothetical protein
MRSFLYRLSVVITVAWALSLLPSPTESVPLRLKNGIVGIVALLYVGKMLYDTLFYDRYQP